MKQRTDFPEHCRTRLLLRVRFLETDAMGVVHHSRYLGYVEAGRIEYLRRRGADYRAFVQSGYHMPVVEAHLDYRRPAVFDDELAVEERLGGLTRVTLRFDYRVRKITALGEELICEGYTGLACIDSAHRPRRIPAEVVDMLLGPERV